MVDPNPSSIQHEGYSDDKALLLANYAKLAYIEFEKLSKDSVSDISKEIVTIINQCEYGKDTINVINENDVYEIVEKHLNPYSLHDKQKKLLRESLDNESMELVATFFSEEGGFDCQAYLAKVKSGIKKHALGEKIAVLAFRGSETKIQDWAQNFSIGDVQMQAGPEGYRQDFQLHYGFLVGFKILQEAIELHLQRTA